MYISPVEFGRKEAKSTIILYYVQLALFPFLEAITYYITYLQAFQVVNDEPPKSLLFFARFSFTFCQYQ